MNILELTASSPLYPIKQYAVLPLHGWERPSLQTMYPFFIPRPYISVHYSISSSSVSLSRRLHRPSPMILSLHRLPITHHPVHPTAFLPLALSSPHPQFFFLTLLLLTPTPLISVFRKPKTHFHHCQLSLFFVTDSERFFLLPSFLLHLNPLLLFCCIIINHASALSVRQLHATVRKLSTFRASSRQLVLKPFFSHTIIFSLYLLGPFFR